MTPFATQKLDDGIRQAVRRTRAMAAAFHRGPVFRQRFDAHVQAWKRHFNREAYELYHTDTAFAAAHDARIAELRAEPMPAWKGV